MYNIFCLLYNYKFIEWIISSNKIERTKIVDQYIKQNIIEIYIYQRHFKVKTLKGERK